MVSAHPLLPAQDVSNILDLGCGTGRYSTALAELFNASVTGIDPSEKMLEQARGKCGHENVSYLHAPAEKIPLEDLSVDLVFLSNVFHHLNDRNATASECRRVLKSPGHLVIRNSTSNQTGSFPYIAFFPGIEDIIRHYQPSVEEVETLFLRFGFEQIAHDVIPHTMARNWRAFSAKAKRRADSLLVRLADEDYQEGMRALEAHAAREKHHETVTVNIDLFVFRTR